LRGLKKTVKRLLGIPTAIDRVIQQSIAQELTPIYEKKFVDNSYGFRPLRDAKQAIRKSEEYLNEGYTWVVDIDLECYFDTVNHDKLMRIISKDVKDGRVISLIRKYLKSEMRKKRNTKSKCMKNPSKNSKRS